MLFFLWGAILNEWAKRCLIYNFGSSKKKQLLFLIPASRMCLCLIRKKIAEKALVYLFVYLFAELLQHGGITWHHNDDYVLSFRRTQSKL